MSYIDGIRCKAIKYHYFCYYKNVLSDMFLTLGGWVHVPEGVYVQKDT